MISLLTPGLQSSLLLIHSFTLGSHVRCPHLHTLHLIQGCEDYSFLDQAVTVFEQSLDSILTDSIETLELETSFDEPGVITSAVSSGFLCLVSIVNS